MPKQSWTLTDVERGVFFESFALGPGDVAGSPPGWSVRKRTLRGGKQDGVDVVEVNNGRLRFVVLPTRGMSLWKCFSGEHVLGWQSPVRGPVHPAYVPVMEGSGLGWLDGFDELLVRCGLESNGAPDFDSEGKLRYPLHGRIGNLPAHRVTLTVNPEGEITVTGVVEETRFHFLKLRLTASYTTRVGEPRVQLHDEVENLSGAPAACQMLYHVNFGVPLLDPGARLVAPVQTVVPRNKNAARSVAMWDTYPPEQAGAEEQVYFCELLAGSDGRTRTLLRNAHGTQGASLVFSKKQLPHFTQWKNFPTRQDGYVTGIEPGTNFPNPRTFEGEQKRVVELPAGGQAAFDLTLDWHLDAAAVLAAEKAIAALQGTVKPKIHDAPQPGWCA